MILFHPAEENELVSSTLNGKLHFSIRIKSRLQQALINTFGYEPEAPVQLEILAGDKGLRAVTDLCSLGRTLTSAALGHRVENHMKATDGSLGGMLTSADHELSLKANRAVPWCRARAPCEYARSI